jgi:isopentenyl-diphosphate delta-isomerase
MEERVILVDSSNQELGTMEKMEAHKKGLLHRAFSIFIFNSHGDMLLQQRAREKYHCGGLWTNAVCSHPRPGERIEDALARKMDQEMGFFAEVSKVFEFKYRADLSNGLVEHEYDEVFFGVYDGPFAPNPEEVQAYEFVSLAQIRASLNANPELFTPWFRLLFGRISLYHSDLKRA